MKIAKIESTAILAAFAIALCVAVTAQADEIADLGGATVDKNANGFSAYKDKIIQNGTINLTASPGGACRRRVRHGERQQPRAYGWRDARIQLHGEDDGADAGCRDKRGSPGNGEGEDLGCGKCAPEEQRERADLRRRVRGRECHARRRCAGVGEGRVGQRRRQHRHRHHEQRHDHLHQVVNRQDASRLITLRADKR